MLQEITGSAVSRAFLAHVLRRNQGSVPVRDLLRVLSSQGTRVNECAPIPSARARCVQALVDSVIGYHTCLLRMGAAL